MNATTRMRLQQDERGFTLVELLIVIVVLGVLAGVTVLAVGGVDKRGVAAACRSDFKSVEVAQQAHYAKSRTYALDATALAAANFLASPPANTEYSILTNQTDGKVTVKVGTAAASPLITTCDALN